MGDTPRLGTPRLERPSAVALSAGMVVVVVGVADASADQRGSDAATDDCRSDDVLVWKVSALVVW